MDKNALLNKWIWRILLAVQFAFFAILCTACAKYYVAQDRIEVERVKKSL